MKKFLMIIALILIPFIVVAYVLNPFRAPGTSKQTEVFIVSQDSSEIGTILDLETQGFIRSFWALNIALDLVHKNYKIKEGGYYLSKSMNAFQIADKITKEPDLKWISIPEGLRKEQIGERLQTFLGWSNKELDKWNNTYTAQSHDNFEGVYFPDTYLIPVKETGLEIAKRMIARFNEVTKTQLEGFAKKDILWTTGIKIASLVQREAAGKDDMPLIAGIIWNRLEKQQNLEIDATIQYAKGKTDGKWWSVVTANDIKTIDSSYNTYKHKGLPPYPIANPGLMAINAALSPKDTKCMFYLHDKNRQIHCAVTYKDHLANIEKYLE